MFLRRECLDENALEETVLRIFAKFISPIDLSKVEDCHNPISTNKAPQKVIVTLSKRKGICQILNDKFGFKNADLTGTGI